MKSKMCCGLAIFWLFYLINVCLAGTYSGGSGTPEDPYRISAVADWQELIAASDDWDKQFILLNDIDFDGIHLTPVENLSGVLDGNGHSLRNADILLLSEMNVGLFRSIDSTGQIRNLGAEGISVSGVQSVGVLCGVNNGSITLCYTTGDVGGNQWIGGLCGLNSTGTISDCFAAGTVTGDLFAGGLCGENDNTVSQCYATGTVTGIDHIGGLCGHNILSGTINDCYAVGSVNGTQYAGGLCGFNEGSISTCYAVGSVSGNQWVGGLCGFNDYWASISDSFWDLDGSEQPTSAGGWGLNATQMKQAGSFTGWLDGAWTLQEGVDTPRLAWENRPGVVIATDYPPRTYAGNGTEEDPFQITSADDLRCLVRRTDDWSSQFTLVSDIDFAGFSFDHAVIAYGAFFAGGFNGNGHIISNLTIVGDNQDYVGFFYRIDDGSQVNNLGLTGANIKGRNSVGALFGFNAGSTISDCFATGEVSGFSNVGVLCGENLGTITNGYARGNADGISNIGGLCGYNWGYGTINNSYSVSTTMGTEEVGGLCGLNQGEIYNSYAMGTAAGTIKNIGGLCGQNLGLISDSYATAKVSSGPDQGVGGFCGLNSNEIDQCFWDTDASWLDYSDGGDGLTTAEMQTLTTFTDAGWDFDTTWWISPAGGYPHLLWEKAVEHGSLQVTILPPEVVTEGAQWRRDGTTDWLDSGQIEAGIPARSWTVEFKPVANWIGPQVVEVSILPNEVTQAEGTYIAPGSLQVTILPAEAVAEGAQWRRVGTTDWLDSGHVEIVPATSWNVEFKQTAHWSHLEQIPISISSNVLTQIQAVFVEFRLPGSGTETDPYRIATMADWQMLTATAANLDKKFILVNDIDFEGVSLMPVARDTDPAANGFQGTAFTGVLDGNDHILRNAVINLPGSDYVGLIGNMGTGGWLRNIKLENCSVMGLGWVAVLCGLNNGTIASCYATGEVVGASYVGGLCGANYKTISNCYATGAVTGTLDVGGLCGLNWGTISGCYALGNVTGDQNVGGLCGYNLNGLIQDCYSTGKVNGTSSVGGFVGLSLKMRNRTILECRGRCCGWGCNQTCISKCLLEKVVSPNYVTSCLWDTESSDLATSAGGATGKTTAEMKTLSTFTDALWDFVGESANGTDDTWRMCVDGVAYPRLAWEFSQVGDFDCPNGVAIDDLLYLGTRWLATTSESIGASDANSDGKVDLTDFAILAAHWLQQ